jgi:hypothetical protein
VSKSEANPKIDGKKMEAKNAKELRIYNLRLEDGIERAGAVEMIWAEF